MLAIRLQRIGKKGQPSYRLVVAERRSKLGAPPTEDLGSYDPLTKKANLRSERVSHWIQVGAQPTITAHNLLVRVGVLNSPKRKVHIDRPAPKAAVAEVEAVAAAVTEEAAPAEAPAAEEKPAE